MLNRTFKDYAGLALKGIGMGTANVIPGVSGGTIALITGIFEELIDAIKSFNAGAVKLLIKGNLRGFASHTHLGFLIAVFLGIGVSIVSIAKLLEYLFANFPVYIWAYFFGLILASVYFVGRTVQKWTGAPIITLLLGTVIAVAISILNPATENDSFIYLLLCGVVAVCSMILPGLSGSFVLILMGNYELVMIRAVSSLQLDILFPVVLGAAAGLIVFSHFLSWVFKKFRNETISLLTGFILGSLAILWPWKNTVYQVDTAGEFLVKSNGEKLIAGYERYMPETLNSEVLLAVLFIMAGIITIYFLEKYAGIVKENSDA
jgi:putative membrane protein